MVRKGMAGNDRYVAPGARDGLLGANDPPPVDVINPRGRSPFLLIGDHCGNRLPDALGTLGLGAADRERHIAWDIGTAALGACLAHRLDAVFVRQVYSRLAIDCNRDPDAADAIPEISDGTTIPGNTRLSTDERGARIAAIHRPYQAAIAAEIARRAQAGQPTLLVSLHSFTPAMNGVARPWHIGILHDGASDAMALRLLDWLRAQERWVVGDNAPYVMDATDHTVPRHAFAAGLPYAEIEVSQQELASEAGVAAWCDALGEGLSAAAAAAT
jgi:predicted N-formylglutamate amidohydrolase